MRTLTLTVAQTLPLTLTLTFFQGAYGVPMQDDGGSGSFRFFEDEDELRRLCVDAGFPRAGVEVRREGRGCAIIKCVVPLEAEAAAAAEEEAEAARQVKAE